MAEEDEGMGMEGSTGLEEQHCVDMEKRIGQDLHQVLVRIASCWVL